MLTLGDRLGAIPLLVLPVGAYALFAEAFRRRPRPVVRTALPLAHGFRRNLDI